MGGLAFFMFGMNTLSNGLEKASGGLLEKVLAKMSGNIFTSIFFGAVVTAAVQSSTATTVIVIGLVNAGILKLRGAVGIIMGANIGTTMTAQILRLAKLEGSSDSNVFIDLIKPTNFSAILAIAGIILIMFSKRSRKKNIGNILMGVAILFTGMNTMRAAVEPLAGLDIFKKIFEMLQNPLLGVLAGAIVTVCTQSSAASVGILQAISGSGAIVFASAFPIIMGTNIGTCVTPMLSSLNSSKNAKRAGLLHFYFNLIGTILFLIAIYTIQATVGWSFWDKEFTTGDIANFHTIFNLVVTAVFIPFAGALEKLACLTVRDKPGEDEDELEDDTLDERFLVTPNVAIAQTSEAVVQMGTQAQKNFKAVVKLYEKDEFDPKLAENINEREDTIDRLEDRVGQYLIKLNDCDLNEDESRKVTAYFHLISEFERIGDYTINILETAEALYDAQTSFSPEANKELQVVFSAIDEIISLAIKATETMEISDMIQIEPLEEVVDRIVEELKSIHINRAKSGMCKVDVGVHFLDILTNVERISDHCSNIAVYLLASRKEFSTLKKHEYLEGIHKNVTHAYKKRIREYTAKYSLH